MIEIDGITYLTTKEVAESLSTTPQAIRKLVHAKRLNRYRKTFNRENLYLLTDIEALKHPKP